jgi:hypothetical protein
LISQLTAVLEGNGLDRRVGLGSPSREWHTEGALWLLGLLAAFAFRLHVARFGLGLPERGANQLPLGVGIRIAVRPESLSEFYLQRNITIS